MCLALRDVNPMTLYHLIKKIWGKIYISEHMALNGENRLCLCNVPANSALCTWLDHGCQMAGYSQIFRIVCVWPFGLLDYGSTTLCCKIWRKILRSVNLASPAVVRFNHRGVNFQPHRRHNAANIIVNPTDLSNGEEEESEPKSWMPLLVSRRQQESDLWDLIDWSGFPVVKCQEISMSSNDCSQQGYYQINRERKRYQTQPPLSTFWV